MNVNKTSSQNRKKKFILFRFISLIGNYVLKVLIKYSNKE